MAELVRRALRERCCQLALLLHAGDGSAPLESEIEELARRSWALRTEEDA